jgi:hypothetical protein
MDLLDDLEARSIAILREAYALLWLARKAFLGAVSFPVVLLDTDMELPEVYTFRDEIATAWNLELRNEPSPPESHIDPTLPPATRAAARKTAGLRALIAREGYRGILVGIRRDEQSTRAKERVFRRACPMARGTSNINGPSCGTSAGGAASMFADAGTIVLAAFISPYRADRAEARRAAGAVFHEIFVKADAELCERRDPKGHYKKARAGELPDFTGVTGEYEEPLDPDLVLDSAALTRDQAVEAVLAYVDAREITLARSGVG